MGPKYQIKASVKIPNNICSKIGVVLAHGSIINRQSLLRKRYSFGEFLCKELDAYVIAPDFLGETIHKHGVSVNNFKEILNISTRYLAETYDLEKVMGFGHSMGCYVLVESLSKNRLLDSIVNYGGPISELSGPRQNNLLNYLSSYFSTFNYRLNVRNLVKYIFDKETCRYLENVMLKDDEYCSETYWFDFDWEIVGYFKNIVSVYFDLLNEWGKPALLLFGSEDGLTKRTLKHYKDRSCEDNILVNHVRGASHVTPCMDSRFQLSKLKSVVAFYRSTCNIEKAPEKIESPLSKLTARM